MSHTKTPAPEVRVADYIAQTLVRNGIRDIFMVTGGGAMHLNDAFGKCEGLRYVCCHHEQACAMAAEGYARVTGSTGVINVTTGPGGINALNGVFGAWTDSIPMLVISGQVKRETALYKHNLIGKLRQLGDQEADIVSMVKGITKHAVTIDDPLSIRYHLERALQLAKTGRPGPCWIDVPIDVQATRIKVEELKGYDPQQDAIRSKIDDLPALCRSILDKITNAQRPIILAGTGVRVADAVAVFRRVIDKLGVPITTAWTHDLLASDHALFCGRPGTIGDRAGNFAIQNSDLVLVLGSRLNIRQVSYNWKDFARNAFKIQVDVDAAELQKPTVIPDLPVQCDLRVFLEECERQLDIHPVDTAKHGRWLAWCRERCRRYPAYLPQKHLSKQGAINPYHFMHVLFQGLADDDIVVCANATATIVAFQVAQLKANQRLFSNSGAASMGYDLPAAIGAAVARGGKRVICLAGDGSLQMNLQELQTLAHHRWPIKLFVLNNNGYLSIRQTQSAFFDHGVGADPTSGVSFPDFVKVAEAYGLQARRIEQPDFSGDIRSALASCTPEVCEVMLDPAQGFEPKLSSRKLPNGQMVSSPLEDMFPFLDREELRANMLAPLADENL
ncbi:MAG TPA: thiamine pyrophosphate-binding protein [Kiritimatiellia bacterium]|nr:thiamine pyrophosphate-binding protein [Kiritimatiellia bacterium]HPS07016.1 thiamine pyrophosphate-binding protein [Kiritimatiellia bacterium]